MSRLSDRAFQLVKDEIERRYSEDPADQIERVILLARLETLRAAKGEPMSRAEIWEVLSDIAPDLNPEALIEAANANTESPLVGASIGVGSVAVLVATAIGMESISAQDYSATVLFPASEPAALAEPVSLKTLSDRDPDARNLTRGRPDTPAAATDSGSLANRPGPAAVGQTPAPKFTSGKVTSSKVTSDKVTSGPSPADTAPASDMRPRFPWRFTQPAQPDLGSNSLKMAKSYGWQAALKGQNPPHPVQHWGEAAALWRQAIAHLEQIPSQDPAYEVAQNKKQEYQANLAHIEERQRTARQQAQTARTTAPQPPTSVSQSEEPLAIAKRYGWQAAVASQNAPHPIETWADISRLWQVALLHLNEIEESHPHYTEAQQVKERYQANLTAIRQRYQQEQSASQRLQSLQASLAEIARSNVLSNTTKSGQLTAILQRLGTIPAGTMAHTRAQQLAADLTGQIGALRGDTATQLATTEIE